MPRGASSSQEQNRRYTSLRLIGGTDCPMTRSSRYPDLDVDGGARIRKSLCVLEDTLIGGDASIDGNITVLGNAMLDTIIATNVIADFIDSNSAVIDYLTSNTISAMTITANAVIADTFTGDLFGNICTDTTIKGDTTIEGNLDVQGNLTTVNTENILIEDNKVVLNNGEAGAGVTAGTAGFEIDRGSLDNYLVCFDESKPGFVVGTVGNTQCVALIEDTPVANGVTYWNETTNQLETEIGFEYDSTTNTLTVGNINANMCGNIATNLISPKQPGDTIFIDGNTQIAGDLQVQSGVTTTIFSGDNLNLTQNAIIGGNLLVNDTITSDTLCVDTIKANVLTSTGNLNIDVVCGNISNVQALFVDQLFGKNSPINVEDELNMTISGSKITFEAGIIVGNADTSSVPGDGIAIGEAAYVSALGLNGGIAIGKMSSATGNSAIAIGTACVSSNVYAISVGEGAAASGMDSVSIGRSTTSTDECTVAIGYSADATNFASVAIGRYSVASGLLSVAVGGGNPGAAALASGSNTIAVGRRSIAGGPRSISIGYFSSAIGMRGISIGNESRGEGTNSVASGFRAVAGGLCSIAIGDYAGRNGRLVGGHDIAIGSHSLQYTTGDFNIGIGTNAGINTTIGVKNTFVGGITGNANADGNCNVIVGYGSDFINGNVSDAIIIGYTAVAGNSAIAIGSSASSEGDNSISIGRGSEGNASCAVAIGYGASTAIVDQIVVGCGTPTNGTAQAMAWDGQVFQDRSWSDGNVKLAVIDATGNIEKDATGNVCLSGNLIVGGTLFASNIAGNSPVTIDDTLFVQGNVYINGAQVLGPSQPLISSLGLDGGLSGISPDGSLVTVGNTLAADESTVINENIADIAEKINMIMDVLVAHGLMA